MYTYIDIYEVVVCLNEIKWNRWFCWRRVSIIVMCEKEMEEDWGQTSVKKTPKKASQCIYKCNSPHVNLPLIKTINICLHIRNHFATALVLW